MPDSKKKTNGEKETAKKEEPKVEAKEDSKEQEDQTIEAPSDATPPGSYLRYTHQFIENDKGKVLGDEDLEKSVKAFCEEYSPKEFKEIKNQETVLENAKKFALHYSAKVSIAENNLNGAITRYRIRQGALFLIIKKLIRRIEKRNWKEWFAENFDKSELRSVQDYMKLAKTPNVETYAVFGRFRLVGIVRVIDEEDVKDAEDPIGDFLKKYNIQFNTDEETDLKELKFETDVAIGHAFLQKKEFENISKEKVAELIRSGRGIDVSFIDELKMAKDTGKDVNEFVNEMIQALAISKKAETPTRKSFSLKILTDQYIKKIEDAVKNPEHLGALDQDTVTKLKGLLDQIEERMNTAAAA